MIVEPDERAFRIFDGESGCLFAFLASLVSELSSRTDRIAFDQNPRTSRASKRLRVETRSSRRQIRRGQRKFN